MQLRYGLLAELVAAPGEGDALAAFLASAHIGATVGGNATGFSPLSPVAVPLWADPRAYRGVARPMVDPDYTATVGLDRDQARALVAP